MELTIKNEEYITLDDVESLVNMKQTSIYTLIKFGHFPKALKLPDRQVWKKSEVEAYIEKKKITLAKGGLGEGMKTLQVLWLAVAMLLNGCASITDSKMQALSVSAFDDDNNEIENAKCILTNDKGTWYVSTPGSVIVQKSYGDMIVTCKKNGYQTGTIKLVSKSNAGVWGNIVAGGLIGYA
ncbi:MAG: AlpA family phage regulatory protein, partial [Tannerella sp.]|nr:AlpA family phage regulatory protein [Tannerella sp.]